MTGPTTVLTFEVKPLDDDQLDVLQVVPLINGTSLVNLVALHEDARGYRPASGYGGVVPSFFRSGNLARYYLGQQDPWIDKAVAVLACDCGELGCWPLQTRITIDDQQVNWHDFAQPHRPDWDYDDFGPFTFDRQTYESKLERVVNVLESAASGR